MPLPILPSLVAAATSTGANADLVDSEVDSATADGSDEGNFANSGAAENTSSVDDTAFAIDSVPNDVTEDSSASSFLPSNNKFQPPSRQPQARFVGVLGTAETEEIKLTATANNSSPAPAIAPAFNHPDGIATSHVPEGPKVPDTCKTDGSTQCDCCKEKETPKLEAWTPLSPKQVPGLLAPAPTTAKTPTNTKLQPLTTVETTDIALAAVAKAAKSTTTSTDTQSSPIRLTAIADSELAEMRQPSALATAVPVQTKNSAQLLQPIASTTLTEPNPQLEQPAPKTVQAFAPKQTIKVSPTMDLYSETTAASPAVSTEPAVVANEFTNTIVTAEFNLIPASPENIRVSAASFKSLPTSPSKPITPTPEPVVEPSKPSLQEITKTTIADQPIEIAKATPSVEPTKTVEPVDITSVETEPSEPSFSNIDPLSDFESLPTIARLDEELKDFKKLNTFDPTSVKATERIDPAPFLAKLDSPPKTAPPKTEITEPALNNDLIAQQLAAQTSVLLKINEAMEDLKPEPVTAIEADPKLTLSNAAFCTKISGFGQFKPFAVNNFSSSHKTLLYCEVENQTSKQFTGVDGSSQFETVLIGSIVVYDANDQVVQRSRFPAIKDLARQQRRDFYVYFPVQFNDLTSGDYRLELSIEDVAGNETAALQPLMRFSVR